MSTKNTLIKIISFISFILFISAIMKKPSQKSILIKMIPYIGLIFLLWVTFLIVGTKNGYWPYASIIIYALITYWIFYRVASNPDYITWLKYPNHSIYLTAWLIIIVPVVLLYFWADEKVSTILRWFWMIEFYHIIPSFSLILLILLLWIPLKLWMNFDKYSLQKTDDTIYKIMKIYNCIKKSSEN